MIRIAKKSDPKKLEELKRKIKDQTYISAAVHQIAGIITKELLDINEDRA